MSLGALSWSHTWQLGLINPGLLALGGALASVPIIIHLLNRRRVRKVQWAAVEWLRLAMRRHQRRLRMENWLILLLRVAAIVLLGLALARPVLTNNDLAGVFGDKRSVYVLMDNSYSMEAKTQARSVSDLARAEADAVLSGLGREDTISLVVTNDPRIEQSDGRLPFVVVPRTVGSDRIAEVKEAVAAIKLRDAPADWTEALVRLEEQTAPEDVNRLVVLITDFQAKDWVEDRRQDVLERLESLLTGGAAVRIIDVGSRDRRNLTVADLGLAMRRDAFVGRPLRLNATVVNHGGEVVEGAHVSVKLDGDPTPIARRSLGPLPAADATTGSVTPEPVIINIPGSRFEAPGSHFVEVTVNPPNDDASADALGLDSKRSFALRVRDRIRVLSWAQRSDGASPGAEAYLRGVFERFEIDDDGLRVDRNTLYELSTVHQQSALVDALRGDTGGEVDLVILANVVPRGEAVAALRSFVASGGALLVFVGDAIPSADALNEPFFDTEMQLLPFPFAQPEVRSPGEAPFLIDLEHDTGHPLAQPFTSEEAQAWVKLVPLRVQGRMGFEEQGRPAGSDAPTPTPDASRATGRTILRFDDGVPAVVEGSYGQGTTLWVGTSVDHGWFEYALPFFLPVFLDEAAVYATRPDEARRNLEVGRSIEVSWLPRDASEVRFLVPGGEQIQGTLYPGRTELDRPSLFLDRVGVVGIWRLAYSHEIRPGESETVEEHFAVNPDPSEGSLRRADPQEILAAFPEADIEIIRSWEDVEDTQTAAQGELAPLLLWIVFGLLVLEAVLAMVFGRMSAEKRTAPTRAEESL